MALVGHKVYDWHFLQSNAALCITTYAGAAASQKGEHCMALETQLLSYMPLGLHDKGLFCLLLSTDFASFCVCFSIALRLRQIWCPCKTGRCKCALQGSLLSLLPACLRGICILGSSLSSSMQKNSPFHAVGAGWGAGAAMLLSDMHPSRSSGFGYNNVFGCAAALAVHQGHGRQCMQCAIQLQT